MNEPQTDMKLEVVLLGVSDVDRAKAFGRGYTLRTRRLPPLQQQSAAILGYI